MTMRAREILEACVYASDLEAAEAFYTGVLGLEPVGRVEGRHVFFRCGARVFLVFDPAATIDGERIPGHGAQGPGHVAFAVTEGELEGWRAHLAAKGVAIEQEGGVAGRRAVDLLPRPRREQRGARHPRDLGDRRRGDLRLRLTAAALPPPLRVSA